MTISPLLRLPRSLFAALAIASIVIVVGAVWTAYRQPAPRATDTERDSTEFGAVRLSSTAFPTVAPELVTPPPPNVPPPQLPVWSQPVGPLVAPTPTTNTPPPLSDTERALMRRYARETTTERQ